MKRYNPACWEELCGDRITLSYGQCLSQSVVSQPLTPLDWDLGLISGEALVVRRDMIDTAAIQELLDLLRKRAIQLAASFQECDLRI